MSLDANTKVSDIFEEGRNFQALEQRLTVLCEITQNGDVPDQAIRVIFTQIEGMKKLYDELASTYSSPSETKK